MTRPGRQQGCLLHCCLESPCAFWAPPAGKARGRAAQDLLTRVPSIHGLSLDQVTLLR